jgi:hypothetical protein
MKRLVLTGFAVIFIICAVNVFAGPPIKLIKVTVVNKCEWDVPVGLGRYVRWSELYSEEGKEKLDIRRIPSNGKVVYENVQAGISEWTFAVFNETTNHLQYNDYREFLRDTIITITYDYDEMVYVWNSDDGVPSGK